MAELQTQKDANTRAPTTTMKNLVERLRNELALKEKQHKVQTNLIVFHKYINTPLGKNVQNRVHQSW